MTQLRDPSESMAPEAVFYCVWACGPHPRYEDVLEHLASLRDCPLTEAREVLSKAIDCGEVRLRYSEEHDSPFLALDGAVADTIGIRYTFHKLWENNLGPNDIYTGDSAEIVEAYQPLLIEAFQEEGIQWPAR